MADAGKVIKDLSSKIADLEVKNSILTIENEELEVKLNGDDLHKNK